MTEPQASRPWAERWWFYVAVTAWAWLRIIWFPFEDERKPAEVVFFVIAVVTLTVFTIIFVWARAVARRKRRQHE